MTIHEFTRKPLRRIERTKPRLPLPTRTIHRVCAEVDCLVLTDAIYCDRHGGAA